MEDSKDKLRWAAMPFIALGLAMIIVDSTILNVAIPVIIKSLHISEVTAEWLNSTYSLVFAALLITFGFAGDRVGRKKMFMLGTSIFVLASLISATAPNGSILIFGRAVQGIGGAMILPATLATINVLFVGKDRAIAFAIWGSTIGVFGALGPLLGGFLTTDISWRWAFLVNLLIGIIIIAGCLKFVPETTSTQDNSKLDVIGNVLAAGGFAGIVFSLIEGSTYGWWTQIIKFQIGFLKWPASWPSVIPIVCIVGTILVVLFLFREFIRLKALKPVLVDLSLFKIRSFSAGLAAVFVVSLGEFGILFVLPLFLEGVRGYSALRTGVAVLAIALGTISAGGTTPQLAKSIGARGVARFGLAFEAIGLLGLGFVITPIVNIWIIVLFLFIYGIGLGMASAQLPGVILSDVPSAQSGQASGIQSTNRQVGSAFGVAVLGTVFATKIGSGTVAAIKSISGIPPKYAEKIGSLIRSTGGAAIQPLAKFPDSHPVVVAASNAVAEATRAVSLIGAVFITAGFVGTFYLPKSPEKDNDDIIS